MNRRRKILVAAVTALIVAILIPVVRHYQLRAAVDAYVAQLKAQGEPMELAQVLPAPVPPEQNSADILRQAAPLLEVDEDWWSTNNVGGMKMVAPGKAMVLWQQSDVREYDHTLSWQDIAAVMAKDEKAFALLQQIIAKPDFDFQLPYERGFNDPGFFTNLCLLESKRAAQQLSTAVICDLHNGDTASAVENLRAILALTQALRDEQYVISELVRIAIAQIAVDANWALLQSPSLTDAQLTQLQQDWAALDFVQSYENALEMERAMGIVSLAGERRSQARSEDSYQGEMPGTSEKTGPSSVEIFMWRYWWSFPDELRALKGDEALISAIRMAETNGSFQDALQYQDEKLDKLGIAKLERAGFQFGNLDLHTMQSQDVAISSAVIRRVRTVETARKIVITAIALKRYQMKYGNYPLDLQALVPEFLPAVPQDPVDGQPLRYHPEANGTFLLYSVAENGKDDGGNPSFPPGIEGANLYWLNSKALDWVWPQPATEKEIEDYYAHPPK